VLNSQNNNRIGLGFLEFFFDVSHGVSKTRSAVWKKYLQLVGRDNDHADVTVCTRLLRGKLMYAWAKLIDANQLEALVSKDISKRHHKACSPTLLERIKRGLLESPFSTPEVLEFCKEAFAKKETAKPAKPAKQPVRSSVKPRRDS
jgi:hypothetical protein